MVADSKDEEPEVFFIRDSLVQLTDQWGDLAGALFRSARTYLWHWRWQHAAWAVVSGDRNRELEHLRP
ncbi:unnamed protein product [Rangifer tarandus platyrhynchus]|uniref:Uncharacterized protein n=2 Tax=Rangifer tarandus platyrhynchus TaxID=3082113 RepID=A0ACB0DXF5_RANTA|nr:unnamed protein product [Rangifer tarandus platyrhynchus]CAI9693002.1 unnamed protein product [Rangifer tarandus platyrhynchus]